MAAVLTACGGGEQKPPEQPTFHVGGSIAGLSGNLTLQLNGAESLTRSTNGPFSFEAPVEDQSSYQVTITTPPPEQDCTLQGATGKVSGSDVSSVQVTCAQRTYSLGGTVTGLNGTLQLRIEGGETLSVSANGPFTFQTKLPKGGSYSVTVATQPRGHRCAITSGSGTVAGNVTSITATCTPWFDLTSFQAATVVIGQSAFTGSVANQGGPVGPASVDSPWGNPVLAGGKLYFSDLGSNRILGFNGVPAQNGASANFVLGQPDFTSATARSGRSGVSSPEGLSSDGTRLAIADKANSRVLLFNTLPSSTAAEPDLVIGQPDFTTNTPKCGATFLSIPEDVSLSHGKLVVADSANSRVLIWNTLPTTSGVAADLVLGQSSFTTCTGNDANGDGTRDATPTASTLFNPAGVWTDGTHLLVADTDNNRVLLWNQFPTTNAQPADVVLGQPDFTSRAAATTATGMNSPYNVNSTGQQIFVSEYQNSRVTVWNQFPTTNGAAADGVLGQPDFTSKNRGDPSTGTTPSARSLYQPSGLLLAAPQVLVTDYGNNRILVFESR
ncbi:MAG: hypothetical protein ACJ8AT_36860 [Hyalangium sp.]|uniref:hypothetical protein n=1 Tax=Hyalangium sp. TaxID=2028555 RepID=UPI003899D4F4